MTARLMRALAYDTYVNGAVRLKHVDVPVPGPSKDEVLIKIEAVSINPVDWNAHKLRTMLRPLLTKNSVSIPCLKYLVGLMKDGKLKTTIDSKYPLSKGEEAWSRSIDGHATGKIIVEPHSSLSD